MVSLKHVIPCRALNVHFGTVGGKKTLLGNEEQ